MNAVSEAPALASAAPPRSVEELLAELLSRSPAERVEIITRLAQSLQGATATSPQPSILDFAGSWADMPGTDEEIIAGIHEARNFTRPEISLNA